VVGVFFFVTLGRRGRSVGDAAVGCRGGVVDELEPAARVAGAVRPVLEGRRRGGIAHSAVRENVHGLSGASGPETKTLRERDEHEQHPRTEDDAPTVASWW